ncbi:MAG: thioredoxin family protein [Methanobacteriota archaeon]|nr:MAG: thioredoxin family protein [Euryarchaeota archaeon]
MKIELFTQKHCPNCPPAKETLREVSAAKGVPIVEYDVESVDGMAEAAYYGIMSTPSVVVVDQSGEEIISWRGVAPDKERLLRILDGNQ